jgi:hypothetical protein
MLAQTERLTLAQHKVGHTPHAVVKPLIQCQGAVHSGKSTLCGRQDNLLCTSICSISKELEVLDGTKSSEAKGGGTPSGWG